MKAKKLKKLIDASLPMGERVIEIDHFSARATDGDRFEANTVGRFGGRGIYGIGGTWTSTYTPLSELTEETMEDVAVLLMKKTKEED